MRRITAILVTIFLFSLASAASISLSPSKNIATLDENITISYSVEFSDGTGGIVTITAKSSDNNLTLVDAKEFNTSLEQDFIWSLGNTLAGTYELLLEVIPEGLSPQQTSETLTIEPVAFLEVSSSELSILAFSGQKSNIIEITNTGNIPLKIGPQFITSPGSDVGITPTTFVLAPGDSREIEVSVEVPDSDYDFTLRLKGDYEKNELLFDSEDILVRVYKPVSNLTWEVGEFIVGNNSTIIPINLSNAGNFKQELTFSINTFSVEEIRTFAFNAELEREMDSTFNLTILSDDTIYSIEMSYLDDSNSTISGKKTFPVLFGFKAPDILLNIIVAIYGNSTLRGIAISALVVIGIFFFFRIVKNILFKRRH